MEVERSRPEKYIFLSIVSFWLAGLLISCYFFAASKVKPDHAYSTLIGSYFISIALVVFQNTYRNVGLSLLFCILTLCVPLVVGASWLFPVIAVLFTIVAWIRHHQIAESIGRVGFSDFTAMILTSFVLAVITVGSWHDADLFLLWDITRIPTHSDPLFHAAISAMIKNYGVISVGLDGLVPLNYHTLSHVIRGAISFGTWQPIISTYAAMQLIVSEPLLLMTIIITAETVRPSTNLRNFLIRILFLFFSFCSISIWPMFERFGFWQSYGTSDSYAISLILMMATICTLRIEGSFCRLSAMVSLTLLCTASKISTGTICVAILVTHLTFYDGGTRISRITAAIVALAGWCIFFYTLAPLAVNMPEAIQFLSILNGKIILTYGFGLVVLAGLVLGIYCLLQNEKSLRKYFLYLCTISVVSFVFYLSFYPQPLIVSEIQRFNFLRTYAGLPNNSDNLKFWVMLGKFTLVHFLFTWLLALLAINVLFWDKVNAKYLRGPILFSLVGLVISWIVLFFANFVAGSEYYFSNVLMFIAMPYLLILISDRIDIGDFTRNTVGNILPIIILCGAISGPLIFLNEKVRVKYISAMQDKLRLPREPYNHKFMQIVDHMKDIKDTPTTKNLAIYIAKEEKYFWDVQRDDLCRSRPFIIPAVSERPGLFALPDPLKCNFVVGYGYDRYQSDEFKISALPRVSHEVLIKKALDLGFDGYVDLKANGWMIYRNNMSEILSKKTSQ